MRRQPDVRSVGRAFPDDGHGQIRPEWHSYCGGNPIANVDPSGHDFGGGPLGLVDPQVLDEGTGSPKPLRYNPSHPFSLGDFLGGICCDPDNPIYNIIVGVGDGVGFGLPQLVRSINGTDEYVDENNGWHTAGQIGGEVLACVITDGASAEAGEGEAALEEGEQLCEREGACFVAGTKVLLADGGTVPIEQIRTGDQVLTRDQNARDDKPSESGTVAQTYVHFGRDVETVTFSDGAKVTCTPEHPFYVHGKGFVLADSLRPGDKIGTADGSADRIVAITKHTGMATVYNFEVAGDHTYFVAAGSHGLWVHNDCGQLARGRQMHEEMSEPYRGQDGMKVNEGIRGGRRPDLNDEIGRGVGEFKSARDAESARSFWQLSDYADTLGYEYGQIIPYP